MKANLFSRIFFLVSMAVFVASTSLPAFSQDDPNKEILVYFTAGIERAPQGQPARVVAPAIQALLSRFNIGAQAVRSAFPDFDERDTLRTTQDGRAIGMANMSRIFKISVANPSAREAIIEALKKLPNVLFAEPNGGVEVDLEPNDVHYTANRQWGIKNVVNGVRQEADIKAPEAWDIYTGSSQTKIAVIDGGVDQTHPDLSGKVSGHTVIYDHHGTHVAGIAAAKTNNSTGIAGVNWNAQILAK
jgi:subtilisin family serine protease